MEYGWIMLVVLAVMGGIIAYLGDKIGSRHHFDKKNEFETILV